MELMAAMSMPILLLQKPMLSREHGIMFKASRDEWCESGNIDALVQECRTIQGQLCTGQRYGNSNGDKQHTTQVFVRLMLQGKVKAALRVLDTQGKSGVCLLTELFHPMVLRQHHNNQFEISSFKSILYWPTCPSWNPPSIFSSPNATSSVVWAVRWREDLDGSSQVPGWCRPIRAGLARVETLVHFLQKSLLWSVQLCSTVGQAYLHYYNGPCRTRTSHSLHASGMDCPRVHPVGIGETICRIIAKAILRIIGPEIQEVAGFSQLYAGQESGCETAVHAMQKTFSDENTEAILQVDANNAFNCLNRESTLRNIQVLCPSFATALINTYRSSVELFIDGETIISQEGTPRETPSLWACIYALGILPLIKQLDHLTR